MQKKNEKKIVKCFWSCVCDALRSDPIWLIGGTDLSAVNFQQNARSSFTRKKNDLLLIYLYQNIDIPSWFSFIHILFVDLTYLIRQSQFMYDETILTIEQSSQS